MELSKINSFSIPKPDNNSLAVSKWSIVFLFSGSISPGELDIINFAQKLGFKSLLIYLDRDLKDLKIDKTFINFDIIEIKVSYKSVDMERILSMPSMYKQIKKIIVNGLNDNGIIITSSYDLLVIARLISIGRNYKLRHQVRDLHQLQLSNSLKSYFFIKLEAFLLKKVECLMISSPEFFNQYYKKIYKGKVVILENVPSKQTWADFKKSKIESVFTIGFIGIIRYKKSMHQLIKAVQILANEGFAIKVVFAGGGDIEGLLEGITDRHLFEILGSYEYTKDIKRLYKNIDLIYTVYDSYNRNCQLAMPNKFYESIITKIPILVAKNTFLESEVFKIGIGSSVMSDDIDSLVELLRSAIKNEGWYVQALENLNICDASFYFDAYNKALKDSILS